MKSTKIFDNKFIFRFFLSLTLVSILSVISFSDPPEQSSENQFTIENFRLLHSDSMELLKKGEKIIITLEGNVKATIDSNKISCNRATWYDEGKMLHLSGEIVIKTEKGNAFADSAIFYIEPESLVLWGQPLFENRDDGLKLEAGTISFDNTSDMMLARDQPVLTVESVESDGTPILINGNEMSYNTTENLLIVAEHVSVSMNNLNAVSDSLFFFIEDDKTLLRGNVSSSNDNMKISADETMIYLEDKEPKMMEARNDVRSVRIVSEDMEDTISGDTLYLWMNENEEADSVYCLGHAKGKYHPIDNNGEPTGEFVEINGDMLHFIFQDGDIERVYVDGMAYGSYFSGKQ